MDQIVIRKSLIIVAIIISAAIIVGQVISSYAYIKTITSLVEPRQITVIGTGEKEVKSDLAVWGGTVSREGNDVKTEQDKLEEDILKVKKHLFSRGIKEGEIFLAQSKPKEIYEKDENGDDTEKVNGFIFSQTIEIRSSDVDKIGEISFEIEAITNLGVHFDEETIKFFCTKINDLKLETYALATENAKAMAQGLAKKNGSEIKYLSEVQTGAFKLISPDAPDAYEESSDDTISIEKKAIATVTAVFEVK
jgi:uncharacterized protein